MQFSLCFSCSSAENCRNQSISYQSSVLVIEKQAIPEQQVYAKWLKLIKWILFILKTILTSVKTL